MRFVAVRLAGLLVGGAALAEPAVLLFPGLGRPEQVTLTGRVLREAPRGSSALSRNLRQLLSANWEGAPVEVAFGGQRATTTSRHDGTFEVTFTAAAPAAFPQGLSGFEARVPGASAKSTVEVASPRAPFLVISDFDDTLAVSNVVDKRKLVESALLKEADTLPAVPGMSTFFRCLRAQKEAPAPFALVSGSPVQYVPRTLGFLSRHQFPFFGLYLRDLGPNTLSDYKQPVIRSLLKQFPHPVVLVGDSGEKDPEVYAQIRSEFPGRVKAIYIRDAGRADDAGRFKDMVLFRRADEATTHAAGTGLLERGCADAALRDAGTR